MISSHYVCLLTASELICYSGVYTDKLGAAKPPTSNYYRSRTVDNPSDCPWQSMPHSLTPLIVHQTWGHRQINTLPEDLRRSVEKWLQFVVEGEMAYFLWEDEGIVEFINQFTPESHEHYTSLPSMVEKTDYFRILVATYVGRIVSPTITMPYQSPSDLKLTSC